MRIFGLTITRKEMPRTLSPVDTRGGWFPLIRESFAGAWQENVTIDAKTVLTFGAVFACVTLIASDIGKLCLRLMEQDDDGVWIEIENPAYTPVLREPNRYQTTIKFVEQWMTSKLIHGNTYVLKQRDRRGVVTAMYVLDPSRVVPMVAPDGSIYYQLGQDNLTGLPSPGVTVPASEIIHDQMVALYHPLVGVSPITACGISALQGLKIQANSSKFFANGSLPGGILTAPGAISQETATRLKAYWDDNFTGDNVGKVAVVGDGLKYEGMAVNAVDAQLIEQLNWTGANVCTCYHVPAYMVGIGPPPPYANVEPLIQQYYSQCLQNLIVSFEQSLDRGLGIRDRIAGRQYGVSLDEDDLIWMNATARGQAAKDSAGTLSPNEQRRRYFNAPAVEGGDSPMVQQQYYSLEALNKRDEAGMVPPPPPQLPPSTDITPMPETPEKAFDVAKALDLILKGVAA